jgi:hypothetical protein
LEHFGGPLVERSCLAVLPAARKTSSVQRGYRFCCSNRLRGEPNGLAQGQYSGRFGIDRDGWNLVGFAASVSSSITMAVARISGQRNEGYGRASRPT